MRKLYSVYRVASPNVGDANCSPILYYNFDGFEVIPIKKNKIERMDKSKISRDDVIIYGGGIVTRGFTEYLKELSDFVFVWGGGLKGIINRDRRDFNDNFSIREYFPGEVQYVPCVSCKSNLFDMECNIKDHICCYSHFKSPLPYSFDHMTNKGCIFEEAIRFLASYKIVITNSYHGAYWSCLLNKKVIVTNEINSKIRYMKWNINFIQDKQDIFHSIVDNRLSSSSNALEEARRENDRFYKYFMERV
jgi:hypothetical protein